MYRVGVAQEGKLWMLSDGITEHCTAAFAAAEEVAAIIAETDTVHPIALVA